MSPDWHHSERIGEDIGVIRAWFGGLAVVVLGLCVVVGGIALIVLGTLGRTGKLTRQSIVGLRTKAMLASDEAWKVAQDAAASWVVAASARPARSSEPQNRARERRMRRYRRLVVWECRRLADCSLECAQELFGVSSMDLGRAIDSDRSGDVLAEAVTAHAFDAERLHHVGYVSVLVEDI